MYFGRVLSLNGAFGGSTLCRDCAREVSVLVLSSLSTVRVHSAGPEISQKVLQLRKYKGTEVYGTKK